MGISTSRHHLDPQPCRIPGQDGALGDASQIAIRAAKSWEALALTAGNACGPFAAMPPHDYLEGRRPHHRDAAVPMSGTPTAPFEDRPKTDVVALISVISLNRSDGHVRSLRDIEADVILRAIRAYRGSISETARRLGVGRTTLYRKLECLGFLDRPVDHGECPLPTALPDQHRIGGNA